MFLATSDTVHSLSTESSGRGWMESNPAKAQMNRGEIHLFITVRYRGLALKGRLRLRLKNIQTYVRK